jgi:hypothetical protein
LTRSVLKNASKYFNALIGPHFSEGQNLGNQSLTKIPLLDDNAEAMAVIFNIIHSQNSAIRETPDPDEILQIAITADKSDCIVPLAYAIKYWLNCANVTDGR